MKTKTVVRRALVGSGMSAVALAVLPTGSAFAATSVNVPCFGPGGGAAGLVAAVNTANGAGGGTIHLASGCTYTLTTSNPSFGGNGVPVVHTPITITGAGATIARSSSAPPFRLIEVDGPGGILTLIGLTLTGGSTPGPGGGLFNNAGTLTLNTSVVTGNTSKGGMMSAGGGVASGAGTLVLNSSKVTNNKVIGGGGGGGILNHGGTLIANSSQVSHNAASGSPNAGGGGIASGPGGSTGSSTLRLNASQVNDNTSTSGPMSGAGGIANGGNAFINASQVNGNAAPGAAGGGILNHGTMAITSSQVSNNTALSGGLGGGAIANVSFGPPSVLRVTSSLVRGNSTSGLGGGIANIGATLTLTSSAVIGNAAAAGGGIANQGGTVTLKAALVAANVPDNCEPLGSIQGCTH